MKRSKVTDDRILAIVRESRLGGTCSFAPR